MTYILILPLTPDLKFSKSCLKHGKGRLHERLDNNYIGLYAGGTLSIIPVYFSESDETHVRVQGHDCYSLEVTGPTIPGWT